MLASHPSDASDANDAVRRDALAGLATVGIVYVLAFALGVAAAFDNPARQAFVNEIVGGETLPNAIALNSASFNLARLVGPALADWLRH